MQSSDVMDVNRCTSYRDNDREMWAASWKQAKTNKNLHQLGTLLCKEQGLQQHLHLQVYPFRLSAIHSWYVDFWHHCCVGKHFEIMIHLLTIVESHDEDACRITPCSEHLMS